MAVLYANSNGIYIRDNPAGNIIRAINGGDLMYETTSIAPVTKALNGTNYTWINVTSFATTPPIATVIGWVARENTTSVPTSTPQKTSVIAANRVLLQNEMLTNARYIYNYLRSLSSSIQWSKNAIYAMFGNMEVESYINPGYWQNGTIAASNGFGLTQWSPSTKYTDWAGGADQNIDKQLERIKFEVAGGYPQWDANRHSPKKSFSEFTKSTELVDTLAEYFHRCYERPGSITTDTINTRKNNAIKWGTLLTICQAPYSP